MKKILIACPILLCQIAATLGYAEAPQETGCSMPSMQHAHHEGHDLKEHHAPEGHIGHSAHAMKAMLGSYNHAREASGTAWQPDSSPMQGIHFKEQGWAMMAHGYVNGVYSDQGGMRGDNKLFSSSMAMLMASRPLGEGTLGLRGMFSLDALMGKSGYPELLQTGETANGKDHLIDRQHPHDLFMELAATYSMPLTEKSSVFVYGGLPGEPAIGPAAFMHRASGIDFPDAPISHHWLDSTHITEGVLTTGYVYDNFKIEGSVFNGREPDQDRYDIETRGLDSWSGRLSYNPSDNWTTQVSFAYLDSPEQLSPETSVHRTTASATYNLPFEENNWATTLAWGRNNNNPGKILNGYLLESELQLSRSNTIFSRFENVDKDELFVESDARSEQAYRVNRLEIGYIKDFPTAHNLTYGIGGEIALHFLPSSLDSTYGDNPVSYLLFVRIKLG